MNISIFGLGYVGCVTAACLAKLGHRITGIDINKNKVDTINQGKSPLIEPKLEEYIKEAVESKKLKATADTDKAIQETDISFICVGTPSKEDGSLDLKYIENISTQIGKSLQKKTSHHIIVIRSTVLPGTTENTIIPLIEKYSGKKSATGFDVCANPEFLREGTSIQDFFNPPKIVIGSNTTQTSDTIEKIYNLIKCPIFKTDIKTAEMIKYTDNSFHGLKVCFANEIGNICKSEDIDSHKVMDIFCSDTKLNLSPYYLKPGFAFGGSCIPKDLRAILHKSRSNNLKLPLLESILESNENQIKRAIKIITKTKKKNIGILGLSFKAKTDDLRESPIIEVIETLIGKGYNVKIYDNEVMLSSIFGANKEYITKEIPHIHRLFCSTIEETLKNTDIIIISKKEETFKQIKNLTTNNQLIIDLVRLFEPSETKSQYEGIGW